jgi:hypothetical protein
MNYFFANYATHWGHGRDAVPAAVEPADRHGARRVGGCGCVSDQHFAQLVADIKSDFATSDGYQASYLISQAANELCPAQIWQLSNSAAGYVEGP